MGIGGATILSSTGTALPGAASLRPSAIVAVTWRDVSLPRIQSYVSRGLI